MDRKKLAKGKVGIAGEYFVAGELTRMGYVASITLRNTQGIDILVSNEDGSKTRAVQVKTSTDISPKWILSQKNEELFNPSLFYIFVNLKKKEERPEYFVVPSEFVARYVKRSHQQWLDSPSASGKPRKDSKIRNFRDEEKEFYERWDLLNLD